MAVDGTCRSMKAGKRAMLVEGSETLMVWDVNSAYINLIVERMELIVHHRCSQPGRRNRIL